MVIVEEIDAKTIKDSRGDDTISVEIKTRYGKFSSSAPNGKSRGKHEAKPYKKSLSEDIKTLKKLGDYFSKENIEGFEDLRRIEDILDGHVGANSIIAIEFAVLKAISKEKKIEIWQIINPSAKKLPRIVGNCIGGGAHTVQEEGKKKPDFQEFVLVPDSESVIESSDINSRAKFNARDILLNIDKNFKERKNDEDAWIVSLNDKEVLEVLKDVKDNIYDERKVYLDEGFDAAASIFYKRKKYHYENPKLSRSEDEQFDYLCNLIKNYNLFYIEDPFHQEDFERFSKLLKKFPERLIVGDDLTVTNYKRLEKAIKEKSINGIIIKPNQNGSLIELKRVVELAKKNNIKTIFSHRSGETDESILADLAFGFQADFIKCGITGKEREAKIKRLIEIEKNLI